MGNGHMGPPSPSRHDWKYYLPATSFVSGKKEDRQRIGSIHYHFNVREHPLPQLRPQVPFFAIHVSSTSPNSGALVGRLFH